MFEKITNFLTRKIKKENGKNNVSSKDAAKERLHLVLMQDRANFSVDFLEMMKQEIIEVIKKYIEVDENAIDVKLTNRENDDGTNGAPALYANIPILNMSKETKENQRNKIEEAKAEEKKAEELKEANNKEKSDNENKEEEVKSEKENSGVAKEEQVKEKSEEVDKVETKAETNEAKKEEEQKTEE